MSPYKTKGTIKNWLFAIGLMLFLIIFMVCKFFATSKATASETIAQEMTGTVGNYADVLKDQLAVMTETAQPFSKLAEKYSDEDTDIWQDIVDTLCTNSYAYMVLITNKDGIGINNNSDIIDLGHVAYFSKINQEEQGYYYIESDGVLDKKALLSVIPITGSDGEKELVMLYYSADNFAGIMNEMEFNGQSFFMLIDGDGNVISKLGNEYSKFMKEDLNFFDLILKGKTAEGIYANVHTRMTNGYSGTFKVTMNGEKRTLVYVPLGIENWYVVAGVDENYVTKMENLTWEPSKNIISKLIAVLFVFFGLVLAAELINKIRFAEENRNLENIAETDMLTDLNNKMSTETKIARYMMTSPEKGAVLFVLDIDNFKKINDTMGHAFGDEVLRALGHDIRSVFRVSDVLGRTGGDEFTIFLKNIEGDENIYKESRKMLQFFRDFKVGDYVKYSATASIGVAVYPRDGADFESLYKVADQALYKAKKRGKNQLAFYNEELDKNHNQYT